MPVTRVASHGIPSDMRMHATTKKNSTSKISRCASISTEEGPEQCDNAVPWHQQQVCSTHVCKLAFKSHEEAVDALARRWGDLLAPHASMHA